MILAIDPGPTFSAYVLIDDDYTPTKHGKIPSAEVLEIIPICGAHTTVIEMVASYGMAVGAEVFETCVWIGRYVQAADASGMTVQRMPRLSVKLNICHDSRAKDGNIAQALIDRFAYSTPNRGKGTKGNPGWFYGFAADVWAAYALGVTWLDSEGKKP